MYRLLGFVAAFFRRWNNWELTVVVLCVMAMTGYDLCFRPPIQTELAPSPGSVTWSELSARGPGEQPLLVEGKVDQSASSGKVNTTATTRSVQRPGRNLGSFQ